MRGLRDASAFVAAGTMPPGAPFVRSSNDMYCASADSCVRGKYMIACAESRNDVYLVVPTTPTTSIGALHLLPSSFWNRRPTAAGVAKNLRAIASFTIATCRSEEHTSELQS